MIVTVPIAEDERALTMKLYPQDEDAFISLTKLCNLKLITKNLQQQLDIKTEYLKEINYEEYLLVKSNNDIKPLDSIFSSETIHIRNTSDTKEMVQHIPLKRRKITNCKNLLENGNLSVFNSQDSTINEISNFNGIAVEDLGAEIELLESSPFFLPSPIDILHTSCYNTFQQILESGHDNEDDGSIILSDN
ncbi:hypothetical protein HANVADRAFT_61686 [Hanseniaspora valbyensis NRRL Y-1626]|uniref:Uncharacterized protein n=1 Tax=Hanseniaspora valbyensis NRRL Y-1626 TaxID=766949 RepID=A0A1B7TGQ2_9ASCO|nr:hypothetical protein HANVADRAFT_61686 [Hanseniaspora valbyensis NRRL Y-1626]